LKIKGFALGVIETNCYVVSDETSREAIIIDPGDYSKSLARYVEDQELQVRYVVNTHCHADHAAGNKPTIEATGAKLLIHETELPFLENLVAQGLMFGFRVDPSPEPDDFLEEDDTVEFGTIALRVIETPGHSPGSITLYQSGCAFVGDVLFAGSIGRTDLPGGSHQTLMQSIHAKLVPLGDETVIYSGHGPNTTIGAEKKYNPFLR
jgi:glyoxylase-like metal-dependent hydrolase (beta-lactamase superfamily II)